MGGGRRRGRRGGAAGAGMAASSLSSPLDYLQGACQLHLHARISRRDASSAEAVARFLSSSSSSSGSGGGEDGSNSNNNASSPRLFLWVPRSNSSSSNNKFKSSSALAAEGDVEVEDDDDASSSEWDEALASTESFDGRNLGVVAFINNSSSSSSRVVAMTAMTSSAPKDESSTTTSAGTMPQQQQLQIQCMVISPRIFLDDDDDDDDGEEMKDAADDNVESKNEARGGELENSGTTTTTSNHAAAAGSATFLALQLYARHCFVPAVRAIEALEDTTANDDHATPLPYPLLNDASKTNNQPIPIRSSSSRTTKSHKLLEGLEEKLRELDIALGQCRRTTLGRIPHIVLKPHAIIASAVMAAAAASETTGGGGKKGVLDLDSSGLSSYLRDDTILNEVQSTVNHWIVQIRKVTTLPTTTPFPSSSSSGEDSDSSSTHADLEEVTFWLSLEEALRNIRSELDSPSVALTISLLKAAKRFVATVALENNTGLDAAMYHVTDITNFLRLYPASALASACDWDKIGYCVEAIFAHLPKVRTSQFYDLDRLARLVEASTLTLRTRMEWVLRETSCKSGGRGGNKGGGGIVLGLDYDQYEKLVRRPTQDIFVSFDASYATFSEFFLDQGRLRLRAGGGGGEAMASARNETPAQVLQRIKLHHVLLRERLDAIYYFRTQHEKLRSVVAEVLMGEDKNTISSLTRAGGNGGEGDGDESAAWALREVDEAPVSLFASVDVLDLSPRGEALFTNALEGYDRKVDAIEEHLARLLRDKLSSCQVSTTSCCHRHNFRGVHPSHYIDRLHHIVLSSEIRMPRICFGCLHDSIPSWLALASVQP
jgi:hypothetical protein